MTTLNEAQKAVQDILDNNVTTEAGPVEYNMAIALEGIVQSHIRLEREISDILRKVNDLESRMP